MIRSFAVFLPVALASATAAAQTAPQTLPGLDNFSLPSSQPTPVATPTPAPTPTPTPAPVPSDTPAPRAPRPVPTARATPKPRATPRATPTLEATSTATPLPGASIAPSPMAPAPATAPPTSPAPEASADWWPWLAAAALLAALAGWAVLRRRPREMVPEVEPVAPAPAPVMLDTAPAMLERAPAPASAPPVSRARIELELLPRRGGLNMISATVDNEIVVRNTGDAAAEAVLVEATLIPARSGQDGELGALFARPVARPAVPGFALAPGEERRLRIVSALPLAGVEPLVAGGRAMLVPVVAVNAVYRWAAGEAGQTAAAFVVGVAREGQAKLAPFWLDTPRMHERLAARPHTLAIRR